MARRFPLERCVVPCLLLHRSMFSEQLARRRVRKWERDVKRRWEKAATPEVGVCALDMCSAPWRWGRGSRRVSYSLSDGHLPYGKAHELDNIIPSFEILKDQEPDSSKLYVLQKIDKSLFYLLYTGYGMIWSDQSKTVWLSFWVQKIKFWKSLRKHMKCSWSTIFCEFAWGGVREGLCPWGSKRNRKSL